jgi:hypothetical protein
LEGKCLGLLVTSSPEDPGPHSVPVSCTEKEGLSGNCPRGKEEVEGLLYIVLSQDLTSACV